jgi:hypothetical protein
MDAWTSVELDQLDSANTIRVAGRRADGSPRTLVIVWQVVVGGALYLRSVKGPQGEWYKGVVRHHEGFVSWSGGGSRPVVFTRDDEHDDAIDGAYLEKYGDGSSTRAINSDTAKMTTLRVDPAGPAAPDPAAMSD